jgi:gluconokinase
LVVVVMGVSGSGKTTVGIALAARLGVPFHDADDFHAAESVEKMRAGEPLTDADRKPWLRRLAQLISELDEGGVLACSALKQEYRDVLNGTSQTLLWVYLAGDKDEIGVRLAGRKGHFMPRDLLDSQFDALEIPDDALRVRIDRPVTAIVDEILEDLALP